MIRDKLSRRKALRALALAGGSGVTVAVLAGCGETQVVTETRIQEVIKEVPVERVVTKIVKEEVAVEVEKVVTQQVEVEKVVIQIEEKVVTKVVKEMATAPPSVELEVWYNQQRGGPGMHGIWNKAALDFQSMHSNIRVSVTPFAHGDMEVKVLTAVAGGVTPDIAYLHQDWTATFAHKNVIHADEEFLNSSEVLDDFHDGVIAEFKLFGKTWGLPVTSQPGFSVYNRNITEALGLEDPWDLYQKGEYTTDWYFQYLEAARQGEGVDSIYGAGEFAPVLKVQYVALWGFDAPVWNEDVTEMAFHTDKAAEAWNWLADPVKNGWVPSRQDQSATVGGSAGLFNSGKLGMILWHARQNNQKYAEATRRAFSAASFEPIQPAIVPHFNWPVGGPLYRNTGNGYGVLQASKTPDDAWDLLIQLVESVGRGHMGLGLSIPTKKSLANAEEFVGSFHPWEQEHPEVFDVIQTAETPSFLSPPGYTEIQTMARAAYDEIVLADATPQEAMGEIKSRVDDILANGPKGMKRTFPGDM
jgi:ABC-type glycerol-3-phosphate transport system substrate-binding protein